MRVILSHSSLIIYLYLACTVRMVMSLRVCSGHLFYLCVCVCVCVLTITWICPFFTDGEAVVFISLWDYTTDNTDLTRPSCFVIREPGVHLIITVFVPSNLCLSPRHLSFLKAYCFSCFFFFFIFIFEKVGFRSFLLLEDFVLNYVFIIWFLLWLKRLTSEIFI